MDKMREEFEAWVTSYAEKIDYTWKDKVTNRDGVNYKTTWVDSAWIGWKASRESMVIELPISTYETPSGDNALREDAVFDALESAGIEVVQK